MIELNDILFIFLGISLASWYYTYVSKKKLKTKYEELRERRSEVDKELYEQVVTELEESKENEKNSQSKLEKLEKYLGLVDKYRYGIFIDTLSNDEEKVKIEAGFTVTKRGSNQAKVECDVNDIRANKGKFSNVDSKTAIKELIDGWYDIDDSRIKWIEPNESLKREINIDSILD